MVEKGRPSCLYFVVSNRDGICTVIGGEDWRSIVMNCCWYDC